MTGKLTKGERKRIHIVEVAAFLMWRSGFNAVSINDIARQGKINKASVYQHFVSKEALGEAVIEFWRMQIIKTIFEPAFQSSKNSKSRLKAIFLNIYNIHKPISDEYDVQYGCPLLIVGSDLAARSNELREAVEAAYESFREYYVEIVTDHHRDHWSARKIQGVSKSIISIMHGIMMTAKIENRPEAILEGFEVVNLVAGIAVD